jgi:2Fe-2S iron-sulfur cluster protein
MSVKFSINGMPAEFDGPDDVPLLWVVREHLNLTGSKFGCGIGVCGTCTADPGSPRTGTVPGLRRTAACCAAPGTRDRLSRRLFFERVGVEQAWCAVPRRQTYNDNNSTGEENT